MFLFQGHSLPLLTCAERYHATHAGAPVSHGEYTDVVQPAAAQALQAAGGAAVGGAADGRSAARRSRSHVVVRRPPARPPAHIGAVVGAVSLDHQVSGDAGC